MRLDELKFKGVCRTHDVDLNGYWSVFQNEDGTCQFDLSEQECPKEPLDLEESDCAQTWQVVMVGEEADLIHQMLEEHMENDIMFWRDEVEPEPDADPEEIKAYQEYSDYVAAQELLVEKLYG